MKDNNSPNNNTSNAIANQALQKKSDGVSLEPPTTKLSFVSKKNTPIQKKENSVIQLVIGEVSKNAISPQKEFERKKAEKEAIIKLKTPENITEMDGAKFENTVVTSPPPEVKVEVSPGSSVDAVQQIAEHEKMKTEWAGFVNVLEVNNLNEPKFKELCAKYFLARDGGLKTKTELFDQIVKHLESKDAQSKPKILPNEKPGDPNVAGKKVTDNKQLWSGTKEQAKAFAKHIQGLTLDLSAAGIFDGFDTLGANWVALSSLYAKSIEGKLDLHMYRGVRKGSVFDKTEWPIIKDKILHLRSIQPTLHIYANHGMHKGQFSNFGALVPKYGDGEDSRKQVDEKTGLVALAAAAIEKYDGNDDIEKTGGYWPKGNGGEMIDGPGNEYKIKEGEDW